MGVAEVVGEVFSFLTAFVWVVWVLVGVLGIVLMPLSVPAVLYDFVFSKGEDLYQRAFVITVYSAAWFVAGMIFLWYISDKQAEEALIQCSKKAVEIIPHVKKCRCPRRALDQLVDLANCIAEIRERI
jgi:uncharacterized membrane protein